MEYVKNSRLILFASGIFAVTLVIQAALWLSPLPYVDDLMWQEASQSVASGLLPEIHGPIAPHPGTTITVPAALSQIISPGNVAAFNVAMAVLMSLTITAIITIAHTMRPQSVWWLGIAALFVPHGLYLDMTPPSALAAVLTALFVLLVLRARMYALDKNSLALVGACGGVLLATRIDTGIVMLAASTLYFFPAARARIVYLLGFALLFFVAFDPYMWLDPFGQLAAFFFQVHSNVTTENGVSDAYGGATLAYVSFILAGIFVARKKNALEIPKSFLMWLMILSATFSIAIMLQQYHPLRYFFPFIMCFEMLLPLFVFSFIEEAFPRNARLWEYACIGLFVVLRLVPIAILLT